MAPRYPQLHVRLHSNNPFALVSAVRLAMRRFRVDDHEIERFTAEALGNDEPQRVREVCSDWAEVEVLT